MLFSLSDFDVCVIADLHQYYPAVALLSLINQMCWRRGYCTLSSLKIEQLLHLSKFQRQSAIKKLEELGVISCEARSTSEHGRMTNLIVRLPIQQEHFDLYLERRRATGLTFNVCFADKDKQLGMWMRWEYVSHLKFNANVKRSSRIRRHCDGKSCGDSCPTPERLEGDGADPCGADQSMPDDGHCPGDYRSGQGPLGSIEPPDDTSSSQGVKQRGRDRLRSKAQAPVSAEVSKLLQVYALLSQSAQKVPKEQSIKKIEKVIEMEGLPDVLSYVAYVVEKQRESDGAWLEAEFGWVDHGVINVLCRGAWLSWKESTGRRSSAKKSKPKVKGSYAERSEALRMQRVQASEWTEDGATSDRLW